MKNYEEKYKEALEKIKELYKENVVQSSTDSLHTVLTLESAFPELKENRSTGRRWNMYDEGMLYDLTEYGNLSAEQLEWLKGLKERLS